MATTNKHTRDSNKHKAARFHVGVLLDLDNVVGKMAQTSIAMAVEDFYVAHLDYSTSLVLHTKDTKQDDVEAAFAEDQDKLKSILSKIVATASAGVLLVLTPSYTASLTSMLTVQQLQPTVTDIHDLIKNGNYVGYGTGSFVEGLLEQMSFEKSKIRAYDDDKFGEALDSQSVAVVVHEVPYIKSFLAKHCNSYMMVPIYKSAGFGFAFPKGSPLVPDISKAIVNITDGDEIIKISKKWIEDKNCQDNSGFEIDSKSLNFVSFWPLFAFNGAVCTVCLIIFYVRKKQCKMNIPYQDTGSTIPRIFPEASDENSNNNPPPKV